MNAVTLSTPVMNSIHAAFSFQRRISEAVVRRLIAAGASIDEKAANGANILHICGAHGDGTGVRLVMDICGKDTLLKKNMLESVVAIAL